MKKYLAITSLLVTFYSHAEVSPIDTAQQQCLDKASTTLAMQQCFSAANKAWDSEMNQQYSKLTATLNSDQKAKLRTAQRAWLKYRDSWLDATKARLSDSGTLASLELGAQGVNLVKNQALALKSLAGGSCANPDDCK